MRQKIESTIQRINAVADEYEQRWAGYLENTHQKVLSVVEPDPADCILDISAGTGALAQRYLEKKFPYKKIVLNDPSHKMLAKARQRFEGNSNISFTEHWVDTIDFEPGSFDKIFCTSALHNYPDQSQAIENFKKLLRPGGILFILDWNNSGWFRWVNWYIRLKVKEEIINTRSCEETTELLDEAKLEITHQEEWYYSYWKFFLFKAQKPS